MWIVCLCSRYASPFLQVGVLGEIPGFCSQGARLWDGGWWVSGGGVASSYQYPRAMALVLLRRALEKTRLALETPRHALETPRHAP